MKTNKTTIRSMNTVFLQEQITTENIIRIEVIATTSEVHLKRNTRLQGMVRKVLKTPTDQLKYKFCVI